MVRLRTWLVLSIAIASLVPLLVLGIAATRIASQRLVQMASELQGRTAEATAAQVQIWVEQQAETVARQTLTFNVGSLGDQELAGFLRLVYRQVPTARIVTLTDARGIDVAPPAYLAHPAGELSGHMAARPSDLERFRKAVVTTSTKGPALVGLRPESVKIGRPYRPTAGDDAVVPVVVEVPGATDSGGDLLLGVEVGLGPLEGLFASTRPGEGGRALLDGEGARILGSDTKLVEPDVFRPFLGGTTATDIRYAARDGTRVLAACAPVVATGWLVVVAEPAAQPTLAAQEIRRRTTYVAVVAALLSSVLGLLSAREISRPVLRLKDTALAVAEGDLGRRLPPGGAVELAELTRAFNFMSSRLKRNQDEIARKNKEIEAFNLELQERVEERTRELREAQQRLIDSARLAAVGEMGAGLAHELNNPLAGILGLSQVLLAKGSCDPELLRAIEREARRCKDIVAHLLFLSGEGTSGGPTDALPIDTDEIPHPSNGEASVDRSDWDVVDLAPVVREVLGLVTGAFGQRGITVDSRLADKLEVRGDRAAIGRAFAQLFASARAAAPSGGMLTITGHEQDGHVVVELLLAGPELRLDGDDWRAAGLGFWAARKAVAAHGGRVAEDRPEDGTVRWRILLPEA